MLRFNDVQRYSVFYSAVQCAFLYISQSNQAYVAEMTDHRLDITSEVCPMTFVKIKLLLERMAPGDIAAVLLKGAEPRDNVPRSVRDHGHEVLAMEPAAGDETYLLRIRKR